MEKNYRKDRMWLSIDTQDMMRESLPNFYHFLYKFNVDYRTYSSSGYKIYMELSLPNYLVYDANHEFHKGMGEWVLYHPINILHNKPKVSDYDIIEDMSIDPYDADKWR